MTTRIGVAVMTACLVLYFIITGQQAFLLIGTGEPVAVIMGLALIVLPLIGVWAVVRELQFGVSADRLGRRLDAEGGMPAAETELSPSGRLAKSEAAALVSRYEADADGAPDQWRAQYRLGVVLDAAGRRKDARARIREAIRLAKNAS